MRWTDDQYNEYLKSKKKNSTKDLNKIKEDVPLTNLNNNSNKGKLIYNESIDPKGNKLISFTIPIAPVTKKNHGQIISAGSKCPVCKKGSKMILIPSKQYKAYEKEISTYLDLIFSKIGTIDYPVNLQCLFYCKGRYKSDLVGYLQAIQDLLVDHSVLADDNRNIVAATDGSRVFWDKNNPRTEIVISKMEDYQQW